MHSLCEKPAIPMEVVGHAAAFRNPDLLFLFSAGNSGTIAQLQVLNTSLVNATRRFIFRTIFFERLQSFGTLVNGSHGIERLFSAGGRSLPPTIR
jgi:hypothetical protein